MYTDLEKYLAIKQILEEYLVELGPLVENTSTNIEQYVYAEESVRSADRQIESLHKRIYNLNQHKRILMEYLRTIKTIKALKLVLKRIYGSIEVIEDGELKMVYDLIGPRKTKKEVGYLGYKGRIILNYFANTHYYHDIIGKIAYKKMQDNHFPLQLTYENYQSISSEILELESLSQEQKVYYDVLIHHLMYSNDFNDEVNLRRREQKIKKK